MLTRPLGASGLEFSTIGVGAWALGGGDWQFGWGPQDEAEGVAAICRAVELGVNWIDTAAVYGAGRSEEVVGRALIELGPRERPLVATKCGRLVQPDGTVRGDLTPASIRRECEASLQRLGVEAIDLYQLHWPDPEEQIEAAWETMLQLRQAGLARHLGVCNFSATQLGRLQPAGTVASLQPPYSLLRREAEEELLPYCAAHGLGVVAYSPMGKGLLTGAMTPERIAALDPSDHRTRDPNFAAPRLDVHLALVEGLRKIAQEIGCEPACLAIAWVLRRPEVTSAIVGARRPQQIEQTAPAGDLTLDSSQAAKIDALLVRHAEELARCATPR